jgi:Protein of unknown function (DUF3604)
VRTYSRLLLPLLLLGLATVAALQQFHPPPARVAAGGGEGRAALSPSAMEVARIGNYELTFTVGGSGIAAGGTLLVAFPKAWFTNPYPIVKPVQQNDPAGPHYVSVTPSRAGTHLHLSLDKTSFTGKVERFNWMMTVRVDGERLRAGDTVQLELSRTTAPYVPGRDRVRIAVDAEGNGTYREVDAGAPYDVSPGEAADVALVGPSDAMVGEPLELHVTAFDRFWNVTALPASGGSIGGLGSTLRFERGDRTAVVRWTPSKTGFYFPDVDLDPAAGAPALSARGNPIRVWDRQPADRLYWGDLHSHSDVSKDGIGANPFAYARDAARLDFFAETDHADDDGRGSPGEGIRPEEWEDLKEQVRRFYAPGSFATLLAYECSLGAPYGHHNVFFRSLDGFPWSATDMRSVQELWKHIRAGEALTIPHHMGISWQDNTTPPSGPELQHVTKPVRPAGTGPQVDWSIHDPSKRPLLEIYSLHGQSERFAPDDPLAYENAGFTFGVSTPGAHYAQDAWAAGLELGTVAASDNHTAQPGQPHGGLTAVRAPALTREAVFDALLAKQTYGTTGERIYLEFTASGSSGTVLIAAPSPIRYAEVMRLDRATKHYSVAARWDRPGKLLESKFRDSTDGAAMYYLRAELTEPVRGRVVRVWSSPVWIKNANP